MTLKFGKSQEQRADKSKLQPSTLYKLLADDPRRGMSVLRLLLSTLAGRRRAETLVEKLQPLAAEVRFNDEIANAEHAAKGFADVLINRVAADLDAVPHLGVLEYLSNIRASRLDYARLQITTILAIKKTHPGMGLGSNSAGIQYNGKLLTGLEIAQGLSILLNLGHVFGTFATERALLYWIKRSGREEELVEIVNPQLRDWVLELLEEASLYHFHYVLAAIEVSSWPDSELRDTAIEIMRLYTANTDVAKRIVWATKAARQLAYNRMHELMDLGTVVNADRTVVLENIRLSPTIGFEPHDDEAALTRRMLSSFDAFHAETFFNASKPAATVLAHLHEFSRWWQANSDGNLQTIIERLRCRPDNWQTINIPVLPIWTRLRLPSRNWVTTVDEWLGKETKTLWKEADFIVTPLPDLSCSYMLVDVYAEKLSAKCLHHVAGLLQPDVENTWGNSEISRQDRQVWRSATLFGVAAFNGLLRDGYKAHIMPAVLEGTHAGYGFVARGMAGVDRLELLCSQVSTEARQNELQALCEYVKSLYKDDSETIWFTLLGTLHLQKSGTEVGEIDGVVTVFQEDHTVWHFLEVKDGQKSSGMSAGAAANKQLERLAGCFTDVVTVDAVTEVESKTAKKVFLLKATLREDSSVA